MTDHIYQAIFDICQRLELPTVLLALAALAAVVYETGGYVVEWTRRGKRRLPALVDAAAEARASIEAGDRGRAAAALRPVAWNEPMAAVLSDFAAQAGTADAEPTMAKQLADFDFTGQRRLARTRLLVRFGPALGLMGTLIPLSPALDGLAKGDVDTLTENLRLAFSITVLGLLVGAAAFALSLLRERMYSQDYSDLEYVAAVLTSETESGDSGAGS